VVHPDLALLSADAEPRLPRDPEVARPVAVAARGNKVLGPLERHGVHRGGHFLAALAAAYGQQLAALGAQAKLDGDAERAVHHTDHGSWFLVFRHVFPPRSEQL
jgi:hypothetical protein